VRACACAYLRMCVCACVDVCACECVCVCVCIIIFHLQTAMSKLYQVEFFKNQLAIQFTVYTYYKADFSEILSSQREKKRKIFSSQENFSKVSSGKWRDSLESSFFRAPSSLLALYTELTAQVSRTHAHTHKTHTHTHS